MFVRFFDWIELRESQNCVVFTYTFLNFSGNMPARGATVTPVGLDSVLVREVGNMPGGGGSISNLSLSSV